MAVAGGIGHIMGRLRASRLTWLGLTVSLVGCGSQDSPTGSQGVEHTVAAAQTSQIAEAIDALFLGSGPLIPRDGSSRCEVSGVWAGFPRGTTVRLRVSTTVPASARQAIQRAAAAVTGATLGALSAITEVTEERDPRPGPSEVTVAASPNPRQAGCGSGGGCVLHSFSSLGVFHSGQVVQPPSLPTSGYVQAAIGAGVLGLCRIDAKRIGGAGQSLMSGGPGVGAGDMASTLTALDLTAMAPVFASPLSPGASRKDFLQVGLVVPQIGERTVRP